MDIVYRLIFKIKQKPMPEAGIIFRPIMRGIMNGTKVKDKNINR
jgi:hypothetical protein